MDTFYIGEQVVTRRGKRGVVVACAGDSVEVRFGSRVFPMRVTQLVHATVYDRMGKGYAPQMYGGAR